MDQHPTRQIPDDELVEIADRPQLWISRDGHAKTFEGWIGARGAYHRPRTLALSIGKPGAARVELAQMSRLWKRLRIVQEKRPA